MAYGIIRWICPLLDLLQLLTPVLQTMKTYPLNWHQIIILTHKSGRGNVLSFASYKSKCVVLPVLGVKTYAFADCFDEVYTTRNELLRISRRRILISMLTDST